MKIYGLSRLLMEPATEAPPAGTFDAVAFRAQIAADNKTAFEAFGKSMLAEFVKLKPVAVTPPADTSVADAAALEAAALEAAKGKPDQATALLQKQIADLQKERAKDKTERDAHDLRVLDKERAASEKERVTAIKEALAEHQFGSDGYRGDALLRFLSEIKRGDDGELYGPDSATPIKEYITATVKARPDWAPAKDVGGAGGRGGADRRPGAKVFNLEDIKPGMKPEDMAALQEQLAHLRG
jgi:hypothetical protein